MQASVARLAENAAKIEQVMSRAVSVNTRGKLDGSLGAGGLNAFEPPVEDPLERKFRDLQ